MWPGGVIPGGFPCEVDLGRPTFPVLECMHSSPLSCVAVQTSMFVLMRLPLTRAASPNHDTLRRATPSPPPLTTHTAPHRHITQRPQHAARCHHHPSPTDVHPPARTRSHPACVDHYLSCLCPRVRRGKVEVCRVLPRPGRKHATSENRLFSESSISSPVLLLVFSPGLYPQSFSFSSCLPLS